MKKLLVAMLVLTFIVATATAALAGTGRWGNATKNYQALPADPSGTDLHDGQYTTATNKCSFCHAVHNAGTGPSYDGTDAYKLLRSPDGGVLGACNFCHVGGGTTAPQPYAAIVTTRAEHRLGVATSVPDTTQNTTDLIGADSLLDCKDCHNAAPHNGGGVAGSKLFKDAGSNTSVTPVCARCHDGNNVGANFNTRSHPMVEDSNGQGNGRSLAGAAVNPAALIDTNNCKDCHAHKKADSTDADGLFPHKSSASRFLNESAGDLSADGTTGTLDAICVACHQWNDGTNKGVGLTF